MVAGGWEKYILLLGICEVASVHVLDRNLGIEGLVRSNGTKVGREGELGRRHIALRNNVTHRDRVAGTRCDLLSIRDGLSRAEIDAGEMRESQRSPIEMAKGYRQVVLSREGRHLSSHWGILAILSESRGNQFRIKVWKRTCIE